jgi:hypothetical protein
MLKRCDCLDVTRRTRRSSTKTRALRDCEAAYCYRPWQVSATGYSYCPHGHGKASTRAGHRASVLSH